MKDKDILSSERQTQSLFSGIMMLAIATIIFGHLLYLVLNIPDIHIYVLLMEFVPFGLFSVVGIIRLSHKEP